jgi:ParB family chromosome partitioning protein
MKTAFENRTNAYTFDPSELVLIDDPKNPLFDPRVNMPLDESLVLNVMFQGVLEPVIVVKQNDKPVVVAGRQRVRAAREANKRLKEQGKEPVRVTAVIRRGTESDLFGVSISENEARQDDTPLGRANKCARYLNMGRSEEEAAVTFGVTKHCVQAWMRLLQCAAPVRKAVEEGKLAASAAAKLADLPADEQVSTLDGLLEEAKSNGHKRPTARKVAKKTGKTSAKTKSRKEILAKLEEPGLSVGFKHALQWVLGEED